MYLRGMDGFGAAAALYAASATGFKVSGVFRDAVNSNAAPLVSLPSAGTPSAIVGLIKTAPTGSGVTFAVYAGSTLIGTGTIAAGATSVTVTTGLAAIAANAVLTLAITAVGSTVAGSDLSVLVRF